MSDVAPTLAEAVRNSPFEVINGELYSFRASHVDISQIFAITRDETETTVIAPSSAFPPGIEQNEPVGPYRAIRMRPAAPFAVVGFLAYATDLLAKACCNVLVISTYSYDYILVRSEQISQATSALANGGFPAY